MIERCAAAIAQKHIREQRRERGIARAQIDVDIPIIIQHQRFCFLLMPGFTRESVDSAEHYGASFGLGASPPTAR